MRLAATQSTMGTLPGSRNKGCLWACIFAVQHRPGRTCSPRRAGSSRGRFESSTRVVLGWFPAAGGHPSSLRGCGGVGKSFSRKLSF